MKSVLFAFFLSVALASCNNSPEQNSTVGNSEDSNTIKASAPAGDSSSKGTGVDNSGGTPGPLTDTAKVDTPDRAKKNRALKK